MYPFQVQNLPKFSSKRNLKRNRSPFYFVKSFQPFLHKIARVIEVKVHQSRSDFDKTGKQNYYPDIFIKRFAYDSREALNYFQPKMKRGFKGGIKLIDPNLL